MAELEAEGFRNLELLECAFGPGAHLILGNNGAGKTSLLEAIYVLATSRSFRTSQISDCCRHGDSRFRLRAEVENGGRSRLELGWESGQRWRSVNGNRTSLADHLTVLPVVSWTSRDIEVLIGSPSERRRLLDRGVISARPAAISVVSRYRRALQEKRQLLVQGGAQVGDELETWNQILAETAAELIRLRAEYSEKLARALEAVLSESQLGFPQIELHYRCSPRCGRDGPQAIERELRSIADRERRQKRPLRGPHRDDLAILWDGFEIRRVASAGERKALGLSLLAAQGRILEAAGRSPIYLLDDADTELDRHRLEALWRVFGDRDQLFATSNRGPIWESLRIARQWRLADGRVVPES